MDHHLNWLKHFTSNLTFTGMLPYLLMAPIVVVLLTLLVFWLFPWLIVPAIVRIVVLTSQFKRKYIRIDNKTCCAYLERGKVESSVATVLFVHGFSGSSVDFVNVAPLMSQAYHLVAVDYLNHGLSSFHEGKIEVNDLVKFLKKFVEKSGLYRRKFHLIGYSLGGCVSTSYAAMYPEDLASLIVCNPFVGAPFMNKNTKMPADLKAVLTKELFLEMMDELSSGKMKPLPSLIVHALVHHKRRLMKYQYYVLEGVREYELTKELLQKISVDVLIVYSEEDRFCFPDGCKYLKEQILNSQIACIKDCGHTLFLTHLKEAVKIIVNWLGDREIQRTLPTTQGLKKEKSY